MTSVVWLVSLSDTQAMLQSLSITVSCRIPPVLTCKGSIAPYAFPSLLFSAPPPLFCPPFCFLQDSLISGQIHV